MTPCNAKRLLKLLSNRAEPQFDAIVNVGISDLNAIRRWGISVDTLIADGVLLLNDEDLPNGDTIAERSPEFRTSQIEEFVVDNSRFRTYRIDGIADSITPQELTSAFSFHSGNLSLMIDLRLVEEIAQRFYNGGPDL